MDPEVVHGVSSRTRDENGELEWDAGRVMRGEYSEADQAPDPSIGKSTTRQGYKFEPDPPHARDADRAFGVPSTRRDLAPPSLRSVADEIAYGDEATAAALVNPGYGAERGVVESDYGEAFGEARMRASTRTPACWTPTRTTAGSSRRRSRRRRRRTRRAGGWQTGTPRRWGRSRGRGCA